jgi:hypothetical protein
MQSYKKQGEDASPTNGKLGLYLGMIWIQFTVFSAV